MKSPRSNSLYLLDLIMETTASKILSYIQIRSEGDTISAKELLHFGKRPAIDQALSRLVKRGQLLRVGRGVFTLAVESRFGERPPTSDKIIESISQRTGEIIVVSEVSAANALGLTTQNPIQAVYLTSGRNRKLHFGKQTVELRRAALSS